MKQKTEIKKWIEEKIGKEDCLEYSAIETEVSLLPDKVEQLEKQVMRLKELAIALASNQHSESEKAIIIEGLR